MDTKLARVMEREGLDNDKAKDKIIKTDKKRASFYNFYSVDKKWGEAFSHDLTLDSGKIGIDNCVELLYNYLKLRGII